jgi:F-type H+-transporting ATPase subunit epsilon
MAETFQFDLVSPERRMISGQALEVQVTGTDGDMTIMAGHAPTITTLRPGVMRVKLADGGGDYAVTGGFVEVSSTGVTVLAERAIPVAELTRDVLDKLVAEAANERNHANAEQLDHLAKRVADLAAMADNAGLARN